MLLGRKDSAEILSFWRLFNTDARMFSYWILKNHILRIVDYEEFHIRRTIAAKTKITSIVIEVAYCTLAIYPKNHGPRSHEASLIDTTQSYVVPLFLKTSNPSWKDHFGITSSFEFVR